MMTELSVVIATICRDKMRFGGAYANIITTDRERSTCSIRTAADSPQLLAEPQRDISSSLCKGTDNILQASPAPTSERAHFLCA